MFAMTTGAAHGCREGGQGRHVPAPVPGRRRDRPVRAAAGTVVTTWEPEGTIVSETFDRTFWEERYHGHHRAHGLRPNPYLTAVAGDLAPGTALDAGCGEGAEAVWLATRGWRVTAVDIATAALRRAREHAETLDADVEARIDWVAADLTTWTPAEGRFDLVCSHYVHPAAGQRALVDRLAAAVGPGGALLVVNHHPADRGAAVPHAAAPQTHVTAEEIAAGLDPDRWDVLVAEARSRPVTGPGGHEITIHDAVVHARRRA
jgi:SAM-dependent methyltransferase